MSPARRFIIEKAERRPDGCLGDDQVAASVTWVRTAGLGGDIHGALRKARLPFGRPGSVHPLLTVMLPVIVFLEVTISGIQFIDICLSCIFSNYIQIIHVYYCFFEAMQRKTEPDRRKGHVRHLNDARAE